MDSSTISLLVTGTVGIITGGGLKLLLDYCRTRTDQENEQDRALMIHMRDRIDCLERDRDEALVAAAAERDQCRKDYLAAMNKIADLMHELGVVKGQVDTLKELVCPFPAAHKQTSTSDVQPTAGG